MNNNYWGVPDAHRGDHLIQASDAVGIRHWFFEVSKRPNVKPLGALLRYISSHPKLELIYKLPMWVE